MDVTWDLKDDSEEAEIADPGVFYWYTCVVDLID